MEADAIARPDVEKPSDFKKEQKSPQAAEVQRWLSEIANAEKVFESYHKRVDAIVDRYRDEKSDASDRGTDSIKRQGPRRYNALWSMKETLKPLLLARAPVPYVTREHDDDDPVARDAALILQRILNVKAGSDQFYDAIDEGTDDYVLAGRGVTWITYAPEFAIQESDVKTYVDDPTAVPVDPYADEEESPYKTETDDDGKTFYREKFEYKARETCIVESVNTKDYLHGPTTRWRHVPWIARRVPMTRDELVKRFGKEKGGVVPLSTRTESTPRHNSPNTGAFDSMFSRAIVWEIWDRSTRKILWIAPDYKDAPLDTKEDALKLESFYPCAKPMFGTMTNDTLIPIPDYTEWQDIALELDDVTHRISLLTDALRVVGVYSEEYGNELKKVLNSTKANDMIPVKNWSSFAENGGLKGAVQFLPIQEVVQTLEKLYDVRAHLVQELYEITGISDIVRGASDPRETASAQKLKGNFANARLNSRQKAVARHARETLALIAEIACTMYSDETLQALSSAKQLLKTPDGQFDEARWQAALQLLRDEPMLMLRVKIDTEDLANENITADREESTQFLTGLTQYLQSAAQMIQMAPNTGDLLGKLLLFAVRKFRVGRALEAEVDAAVRQLAKTGMGQPQGEGQQVDPGMNEAEHQVEMAKIEILKEQNQIKREELEIERQKLGIAQGKHQGDQAIKKEDVGIKAFKAQTDAQIKAEQVDIQRQSVNQQGQQIQQQAEVAQADIQQKHAEIQLSADDQQHRQTMEQASYVAGEQQRAQDNQHREREHVAAQEGAAADRQLKAKSEDNKVKMAKSKAAKPKASK